MINIYQNVKMFHNMLYFMTRKLRFCKNVVFYPVKMQPTANICHKKDVSYYIIIEDKKI